MSIRSQFTLFLSGLAAALLLVSGVATAHLVMIDRATAEMNRKWLGGRNLLGDIRNQLGRFRLTEIARLEAADAPSRLGYEEQARSQARDLRRAIGEYWRLVGDNASAAALHREIDDYILAHDRWQAADRDGTVDAPARTGGMLDRHYLHAVDLTARLIAHNSTGAALAGAAVERTVATTLYIVLGISFLALLVFVWLLVQVRRTLTDPLVAITRALSRLAAGERQLSLPAVERSDEIGQMAKAFDIFRANAVALEQAHAAVRRAQDKARALARYDTLTGLPNRRLFVAQLKHAAQQARKQGAGAYLFLIGLDRFKRVNDHYGRAAGDTVLSEIAQRLRTDFQQAFVARLGGDEFAMIAQVPADGARDSVLRIADGLVAALGAPVTVGQSQIALELNIGVVAVDGDMPAEGLLRAAGIAVDGAKQESGTALRFFEAGMEEELRERTSLEIDLRAAIAADQIEPYYQPLIDLRDDSIYGFELLSRWDHPVRGSVSPDVFVPIAERLGLISDLTWSVLRKGCRDAREWPDDCHLSLNLSPLHLCDPLLTVRLLGILTQAGFNPRRLDVEVTESALVENPPAARAILSSLRNLGIKISLDDFGTGYSSLRHLSELHFDKVKIDRSFILSMGRANGSEKIVDAVLGLAKNLGLLTVAEGVEDPAAAALLASKGCEFGQGYYFGKAMPAAAAASLLRGPPLAQRMMH